MQILVRAVKEKYFEVMTFECESPGNSGSIGTATEGLWFDFRSVLILTDTSNAVNFLNYNSFFLIFHELVCDI